MALQTYSYHEFIKCLENDNIGENINNWIKPIRMKIHIGVVYYVNQIKISKKYISIKGVDRNGGIFNKIKIPISTQEISCEFDF